MSERTEPAVARPDSHQPDHEIHPGAESVYTPQSRLVVNLLMVSAFVMFLNETLLSVALPKLMATLNITAATGQWLSTAYLLTMAIVYPMSGWVIQRFSTRGVFFAAMGLFATGAVLASIAPNFGFLLLGRIIQACGTGVISPLFMTAIMTLVPQSVRGKVMGNVTIVMSVAPAVGPLIGGIIVQFLDWRWLFILVIPFAIAALTLGARKLVNISEAERVPIDYASVVLSAFAFGGLVYGFSGLGEWVRGEAFMAPWIPLTVGAVALVAFVFRQIRLARDNRALLDLRVFSSSGYTFAVILMATMMASLFGTMILLPIYLQNVVGLSSAATGFLMLPGGLMMGFSGPFVGRLYDRLGARALILPGTVVTSVALWAMAVLLTPQASWVLSLACHMLLSAGLALIFTPLFTVALGSSKPHLYSHASAMLGTSQQLSGAAGTALFIVIYTIVVGQTAGSMTSTPSVDAIGAGVHAAFLVGGVVSFLAIVAALFIQTPAPVEQGDAPTH
ncbi:MAG TPA: MDR family MFS transporter [Microbacteriaceae bacterium]|nr:MDR family MFS transporter [Microbacteriaceae bacterium]